MAVRALNVALIFSLVTALSALPPYDSVPAKEGEDRTLPTELQPPPLVENGNHTTVYIINVFAVRNSNESVDTLKNEIVDTVPEMLEPLATILLLLEDDEDEMKQHLPADLDQFAEGLQGEGYKVNRINHNGKTNVLTVKMDKEKAQSMVETASKPYDETKSRQKRTICFKCGGRGRGGGWGGGGHRGGGGRGCGNSCGGRGGGGGGGGGGSWSKSSASAHASSSSGSWGK